jgi:hypothetical protein
MQGIYPKNPGKKRDFQNAVFGVSYVLFLGGRPRFPRIPKSTARRYTAFRTPDALTAMGSPAGSVVGRRAILSKDSRPIWRRTNHS